MIKKNHWKINLNVGSTFIFKGNYCIVKKMWDYNFEYEIQNSPVKGYMTYDYYITTPTFIGRQRNFIIK
jgi:hypothetical protein